MWTIEKLTTKVGYKIKMSQSLPNEVRIYFIMGLLSEMRNYLTGVKQRPHTYKLQK